MVIGSAPPRRVDGGGSDSTSADWRRLRGRRRRAQPEARLRFTILNTRSPDSEDHPSALHQQTLEAHTELLRVRCPLSVIMASKVRLS